LTPSFKGKISRQAVSKGDIFVEFVSSDALFSRYFQEKKGKVKEKEMGEEKGKE